MNRAQTYSPPAPAPRKPVPAKLYQENHYYPFGMNMKGLESSDKQSVQNKDEHLWQYNGKERQDDFNLFWADYGARNYDSQVGRWHGVDALAEKYDSWSPFNYVLGNPVKNLDPDGMRVVNGEAYRLKLAKGYLDLAQNKFNDAYQGNEELTKRDFDTNEEWKTYSNARSDLKKKRKHAKNIQKAYDYVEALITLHKEVDSEGFQQMDNLTYKNGSGQEKELDVMVYASDSKAAGENDGGATAFGFAKVGGIKDVVFHVDPEGRNISNSVGVFVRTSNPLESNKLSHEFGHVETIASNPRKYNKMRKKAGGNHKCGEVMFDYLSEDALKWQHRWDTKYFEHRTK